MVLPSQPIGVFDSGVGGLTVLQQLMLILPHERFIYFGDTARVPYGNKSCQTIIRYSIENTIFLLEKDIKFLVIACNTASSLALSKLRQYFKLPIVGVIDAGAKKAVSISKKQRIAVLGTNGTIQSGAYQTAILKISPKAHILPIACPLFVPLVEEGWHDHEVARLVVKQYLYSIKSENIDTILLGCTHYPLISDLIQQEAGKEVEIVDSALTCAMETADLLQQHQLASPILLGKHEFYVSDDPAKFHSHAERLFSLSLGQVEHFSPGYV